MWLVYSQKMKEETDWVKQIESIRLRLKALVKDLETLQQEITATLFRREEWFVSEEVEETGETRKKEAGEEETEEKKEPNVAERNP